MSHVAAIACHKMWRFPAFSAIRENYALRRQVIAAGACAACAACVGACVCVAARGCVCNWCRCIKRWHPMRLNAAVAAGTTAVMGAPVGALLFSIEVTASYYLVRSACPRRHCASHE
jgi:hypothetical protein